MKRYLYFGLLLLLPWLSQAQIDNWEAFNQKRLVTQKKAMFVLGGWAVGNMATSGLLLNKTDGIAKDFHRMNIGWNAINLGIATLGYLGTRKAKVNLKNGEAVKAQYNIQKVLLFNAGLDIGYMLGGLYLKERAKNNLEQKDRWTGWGNAILYNGAFLFVFDLATYFIHRSHNKELHRLLDQSSLSFHGTGLSWQYRF